MVIDTKEIQVSEFNQEFKKRFSNFCNRIPLFIFPLFAPTKIILYSYKNLGESEKEKLFEYEFDFSMDVKENIFEIKKILQNNYYPTMIQKSEKEVLYDVEKLNYLISEGQITVDDITPNGGVLETTEVKWRIEKIILDDDSMLIRNLNENNLYKIHLKMPVTTFLKNILSSIKDEYERWFLLDRRKGDIELFYEVDKNNKKLKQYEGNRRSVNANS